MPLDEGIPITLDKPRRLRLDLNAMVRFEEATGKSFLSGFNWQTMSVKDIRALIWACLLHEDPALTQEAVGAMITAQNMPQITQSAQAAMGGARPAKKENEDPTLANLPDGLTSGRSEGTT